MKSEKVAFVTGGAVGLRVGEHEAVDAHRQCLRAPVETVDRLDRAGPGLVLEDRKSVV